MPTTTAVIVGGMTCSHCEMSVREALEELPGVTSAQVSADAGTALVNHEDALDHDSARKAIEAVGYTVSS